MRKASLALFVMLSVCPLVRATVSLRALQQPLTLTLQAMTVEAALKQVSQATGIPLAASSLTAGDIVAVRWNNVPAEEALNRLAAAVHGSWRDEGTVKRLIRSPDDQRREANLERAATIEQIRKAIDKRQQQSKSLSTWSPEEADALAKKIASLFKQFNPNAQNGEWYQRSNALSQELPTGRVLSQILAAMDPGELADIPSGVKTVWSTSPTPMQRQMPSGLAGIIEQFTQANQDWNAALLRHDVHYPTMNGSTYMVGGFGDLNRLQDAPAPVAVVLVGAQRMGELSGISIDFHAYDAKGRKIAETQTYVSSEFMQTDLAEPKDSEDPNAPSITLSDDIYNFSKFLASQARGGAVTPTPGVVQKILDCSNQDPLSWLCSPNLIQAAEKKGLNLVASLSDMMMSSSLMGTERTMRISQLLRRLEMFGSSVKQDGNWLMISPLRPVSARRTRADRAVLAAYLRSVQGGKPLGLDDRAHFALRLPIPQDNVLPSILAHAINGSNSDFYEANLLRFYASTTKEQRQKMSHGGLALRTLSADAVEAVFKMVFGQGYSLQFTYAPNGESPVIRRGRGEEYELFATGINHEPTECLPMGLPDDSYVSLNLQEADVAITGRGTSNAKYLSPRDLAWQKYAQERLDLFPWIAQNGQTVDFSKLLFGRQSQLKFEFHFTSSLSMSSQLTEQQAASEAEGIEAFPDSFRTAMNAAYEQFKEAYADAKPGQYAVPSNKQNIPPM